MTQGTAADMSKRAGILIRERFMQYNVVQPHSAKIVGFYHDEWHAEVLDEIVLPCKKIMEEAMDQAAAEFAPGIKFGCVADISKIWIKGN